MSEVEDVDDDRPIWPRETQRPIDAQGGRVEVPGRVAPLVREIEAALSQRDGDRMLCSLRRLIAQTEADQELRWLWAAGQQDLGDTLSELRLSDLDQDVEETIAAYRSALTVYAPDVCPTEFATIQNNLGNAYRERRRAVHEDNLEQAISAFEAALQVRTRDADPYGWGRTQSNLGNVYAERRRGDRVQNQEKAIAAYRLALEVHDLQEYPHDYAAEQTNLGLAYQELAGAGKTRNLDLAMACFLCALLVHSRMVSPVRYRRLVLSLADAFHARLDLTPEHLHADVVAGLRPVADVLAYHGITTGRRERSALPSASDVAGPDDGSSWLPDPDLFSDYRLARYLTIPLQTLVEMVASPRAEEDMALRLELLRAVLARTDLVLPSFRAWVLDELGVALLGLEGGDTVKNQEEAIEALERALEPFSRKDREWAAVQNHLAAAFGSRISGDPAENLERAIEHCAAAVQASSPEDDPATWATYVAQLGQLYRERRFGNSRENLSQAVAAFEGALRVWTRDGDAYRWARVKNSLGLTLLELRPGEAAAAEVAFQAFQDASAALSRDEHPYEWAGVQFNLGRALRERRAGDPSDNVERAIEAFSASLSVRTRDRYPSDWARTQHNLGLAYGARSAEVNEANLGRAVDHLRAALEVHTRDERPADHLRTAGALGELECRRDRWDAAHEVFGSAAEAEEQLLLQVTTGPHGFDDMVRRGHSVSELDAFALARLGRREEALVAVERGRARWLAQALTLQAADPERIRDPARRQRFVAARRELTAAQAAVSKVRWSDPDSASATVHAGDDALAARAQRAAALARTRALHQARERFNAVVAEIRRERDPPDFLRSALGLEEIQAAIDVPLVYLLATKWGGVALAALPLRDGEAAAERVLARDLPDLTDAFVLELVQVVLDDGSGPVIGGYGPAQEGAALNWIAGQWPGETFAEKAAHLHAACVAADVASTLDAAAQAVLQLKRPGLRALLETPIAELGAFDLSRLAGTVAHEFLSAELRRCLPELARVALAPVTAWLRKQGVTAMTLVPCGMLAAFPLVAALLDVSSPESSTVAHRLAATVAPSAHAVLADTDRASPRAGVYTLGDPWPTHQRLRWGEAEALTIATLAGNPRRARVREEASRQWLVEGLRDGWMVSASCHGQFDERDFLRSRLLLANGEVLTLGDALRHEVDVSGLRLLVLSACQTAVLDLRGAYGEVRSLSTGMLQAGAQAVMATLWPVDDQVTYLLMVRFAQEWLPRMLQESPATALARAQVWLRSVTYRGLEEWQVLTAPGATAGNSRAASVTCGDDPDRAGIVAIRGRGDRYAVAEAEQLVRDLAQLRPAGAADPPYADPIFWAGFQVYGR